MVFRVFGLQRRLVVAIADEYFLAEGQEAVTRWPKCHVVFLAEGRNTLRQTLLRACVHFSAKAQAGIGHSAWSDPGDASAQALMRGRRRIVAPFQPRKSSLILMGIAAEYWSSLKTCIRFPYCRLTAHSYNFTLRANTQFRC